MFFWYEILFSDLDVRCGDVPPTRRHCCAARRRGGCCRWRRALSRTQRRVAGAAPRVYWPLTRQLPNPRFPNVKPDKENFCINEPLNPVRFAAPQGDTARRWLLLVLSPTTCHLSRTQRRVASAASRQTRRQVIRGEVCTCSEIESG